MRILGLQPDLYKCPFSFPDPSRRYTTLWSGLPFRVTCELPSTSSVSTRCTCPSTVTSSSGMHPNSLGGGGRLTVQKASTARLTHSLSPRPSLFRYFRARRGISSPTPSWLILPDSRKSCKSPPIFLPPESSYWLYIGSGPYLWRIFLRLRV